MSERTWAGADTPELTLSAIIALAEVTADMGATRLVLGSHRDASAGTSHEGNADNANAEVDTGAHDGTEDNASREATSVPAELQLGDAVLYSGNVLHSGGCNSTADRWREAIHLSFVSDSPPSLLHAWAPFHSRPSILHWTLFYSILLTPSNSISLGFLFDCQVAGWLTPEEVSYKYK